jgi:hypothetical protein
MGPRVYMAHEKAMIEVALRTRSLTTCCISSGATCTKKSSSEGDTAPTQPGLAPRKLHLGSHPAENSRNRRQGVHCLVAIGRLRPTYQRHLARKRGGGGSPTRCSHDAQTHLRSYREGSTNINEGSWEATGVSSQSPKRLRGLSRLTALLVPPESGPHFQHQEPKHAYPALVNM